MKRLQVAAIVSLLIAVGGCRNESNLEVLDEYESADLAARAWSFQVYPGAEFLPDYTSAYRKSHAILNPESADPPPMAVYDTEAPVEGVAAFYAEKYGYGDVVEEPSVEQESGPAAYYTSGDLGEDTRNIADLLAELDYDHDLSDVSGEWRGAHIAPTGPYPRVTIQRPYFHFETGEIRDRTLILMVRE